MTWALREKDVSNTGVKLAASPAASVGLPDMYLGLGRVGFRLVVGDGRYLMFTCKSGSFPMATWDYMVVNTCHTWSMWHSGTFIHHPYPLTGGAL